jgi:uncharacterized tellurite resistance protein B-like protein
MGLFDAFAGSSELNLTQQEAVMSILLLAVAADGDVEQSEINSLATSAIRMKLLARTNVTSLIESCSRHLRKHGVEKLTSAAMAKIDPSLRKGVYLHFLDILLADGNVSRREEELAMRMKMAFGLEDSFVRFGVEMLAEKNRV